MFRPLNYLSIKYFKVYYFSYKGSVTRKLSFEGESPDRDDIVDIQSPTLKNLLNRAKNQ